MEGYANPIVYGKRNQWKDERKNVKFDLTTHGLISLSFQVGDLKFGELKGVDKFGNKYYEVSSSFWKDTIIYKIFETP